MNFHICICPHNHHPDQDNKFSRHFCPTRLSLPLPKRSSLFWLLSPSVSFTLHWTSCVLSFWSVSFHSTWCLWDSFVSFTYQYFLVIYCRIEFHCTNKAKCIHPLVNKHLSCPKFLAIMNKAAINSLINVFWWIFLVISLRYIPRSRNVKAEGRCVFSFSRLY